MSLRVQGVLHEEARVWFIDEMVNRIVRVKTMSAGPFDETGLAMAGTKCHIMARRSSDGKPFLVTDITGTYTPDPTFNILEDEDDGVIDEGAGTNLDNEGYVSMSWSGLSRLLAFIRFQNVTILPTANISAAYLSFECGMTTNFESDIPLITALASDNSPAVADAEVLRAAERTTASVNWTLPSSVTVGSVYNTPDITTIVNEIIGRSGWVSRNAMTFLVIGAESYGSMNAFHAVNLSAQLNIEYA